MSGNLGFGHERPSDRPRVAVAGAGAVGLVAALACARAGCSVTLVGPPSARRDGRTAALLARSVELLEELGAWASLAPMAGALRAMRIVDDTGSLFRPPPVTFRAAEIGLEAFGWNVENATLAAGLAEAVSAEPAITWRRDLAAGMDVDEAGAILRLESGETIAADLVVAADGRSSRLREGAGIAARTRPYPQVALTTVLAHEREHGDVSTEFHTRAGPFTLVPLPDRRSSLVWVTGPAHARRLAKLEDADFAQAVAVRARPLLGEIRVDGPRGQVPLASLSVATLTGTRLALVGEAGHVLPPIGAQGLNLGLADVAALARQVGEAAGAGRDVGSAEVCERYARARSTDIRLRSGAVDGLNRSLLSDALPVDAVRGIGLGLLGRIGPLRRAVMRAGLT